MIVELYTKANCSYCSLAKQILLSNQIQYTENMLDRDFTKEILKEKFPTAVTFPVIVLDGYFIGGYNQLKIIIEEKNNNSQQLLNE
jgi:glutaredoxin 3